MRPKWKEEEDSGQVKRDSLLSWEGREEDKEAKGQDERAGRRGGGRAAVGEEGREGEKIEESARGGGGTGVGGGAVGERVDKLSSSGARRRESRGAMREARGKRHGEGRV